MDDLARLALLPLRLGVVPREPVRRVQRRHGGRRGTRASHRPTGRARARAAGARRSRGGGSRRPGRAEPSRRPRGPWPGWPRRGRPGLEGPRWLAVEVGRPGVELPDRLAAADAVPEPAVDRVLGGVEQADDVAALAHRGVLGGGQAAQEAPSSMGRHDPDAGDRRRLDLPPAGDRQLGVERAERGDDLRPVERAPRPATGPSAAATEAAIASRSLGRSWKAVVPASRYAVSSSGRMARTSRLTAPTIASRRGGSRVAGGSARAAGRPPTSDDPDPHEQPQAGLEVAGHVARGPQRQRAERRQHVAAQEHQGGHRADHRRLVGDVDGQGQHEREDDPEGQTQQRHPQVGRVGRHARCRRGPRRDRIDEPVSCQRRPPSRSATSGTPIVVIRPMPLSQATRAPAAATVQPCSST